MRRRAWISRVVVLITAAAFGFSGLPASTAQVTDAAHHRHPLAVTGFQEEGDPNARIAASAKALTTVGLDGVNLSPDGSSVGRPDAGARRVLAIAHHHHLRAEFLIGNFGRHEFTEARAHRLLSSSANISSVVTSLTQAVTTQGWDGISVDLEALRGRDRAGLVNFLAALHDALPAGKSLSVCISNATTAAAFRRWGYDLTGIAANSSRIILMAYDEHGSWENTPGPVGALRWQKRGLHTVLRTVPAAKIDLGEAGYGYAWRPHRNYQLSDVQARRLVAQTHAAAHFNKPAGEWTARLPDGSTLWWADARSYALRVALARQDRLHGLAVWSLGLSDPIQ